MQSGREGRARDWTTTHCVSKWDRAGKNWEGIKKRCLGGKVRRWFIPVRYWEEHHEKGNENLREKQWTREGRWAIWKGQPRPWSRLMHSRQGTGLVRTNRNLQDCPKNGQGELNKGGASRTAREVSKDRGIRKEGSWKQSGQTQMAKSHSDLAKKGCWDRKNVKINQSPRRKVSSCAAERL